MRLLRDPHLDWDGRMPYDVLSDALAACGCAPVMPDSTITEIKDAFFDVMGAQSDPEVRRAWDELRVVEKRLVVDFFFYPIDGDEAGAFASLPDVELPVHLPDFRELARMDAAPSPDGAVVRDAPPLDLGPLSPDLFALAGGDDE